MTTGDDADAPTREAIDAFIARHAHGARRDPTGDFWWMQPLCPPGTLEALDAFRQLHRDLQQWLMAKGRRDAKDVRFWDAAEARRQGHAYGGDAAGPDRLADRAEALARRTAHGPLLFGQNIPVSGQAALP